MSALSDFTFRGGEYEGKRIAGVPRHLLSAADNLTDKTYASSYVIRRTASAAMPTFLSGNGRSLIAGLSYRY